MIEVISVRQIAFVLIVRPYTPLWVSQWYLMKQFMVRGNGEDAHTWLDIGAICNVFTTHDSTFKYLLVKYRIAGSGRVFAVQKRSTSRDSVAKPSYITNTGYHDVRLI